MLIDKFGEKYLKAVDLYGKQKYKESGRLFNNMLEVISNEPKDTSGSKYLKIKLKRNLEMIVNKMKIVESIENDFDRGNEIKILKKQN